MQTKAVDTTAKTTDRLGCRICYVSLQSTHH